MKRSAAVAWVCGIFAALPLLEIYRSFFHSRFELFGLAAEELVLLIAGLSVLILGAAHALRKKAKKRLLAVSGALTVLLLFTLIHAAWAAGFDASLLQTASPSFAVECYYVLRLYLAPLALLGGLLLLEVSYRELMPAVKICAGLFAGVIVFCCFTGLGFAAYVDGNAPLLGTFFDWFGGRIGVRASGYTVRGLFSDGNALSAVFFLLSPLVFREALSERRKWYDLVLSFIVGFAGIAVGTRVGAWGTLLMLGASLVLALADAGRRKVLRPVLRRAVPVLAILALLTGTLLISPGFKMQVNRAASVSAERTVTEAVPEDDADLPAYVDEHGWDHYVDKWFPEVYTPEEDPDFWREVLEREGRLNQNNRHFKTEMIGRIAERDGRAGDLLLGIGRTSGVPYSEQDLAFQIQVYGVIGAVLLLLPFAVAGIFAGVNGVRCFIAREDATLPLAVCASFIAAFGAAYLAGHVFDTTVTTYALILPSALGLSFRKTETN